MAKNKRKSAAKKKMTTKAKSKKIVKVRKVKVAKKMVPIKKVAPAEIVKSSTPRSKIDVKDLQNYKKSLLDIKEQILSQIKQIASDAATSQKDTLGDSSGHALHMADVASDMYDREFSLNLASNDRELLFKVEEALQRVSNRSFGACTECGGPIAIARLKAIPYAQTCLKCQEKLETR